MTHQAVPFLNLTAMHTEIADQISADLAEVIAANAFIGGPWVERFEQEFATYCQRDHCVGVGNGTDALELIFRGLGIGPGDEVILPANTFIATPEAVVNVGATPVFADVDPERLLLTSDTIDAVITDRTAACVVVHLYGQAAPMGEIAALAERRGIALIEDAAQAHGATWEGRRIGSFGAAAAFSFYPGKNLGAFGDGGAITTDDATLVATIRSLANHGRSAEDRYLHERVGVNSRLDGLQAAVLSAKLAELDRWNEGRRSAHRRYLERLGGSSFRCLGVVPRAEDVFHLEVVRHSDRSRVQQALDAAGIGHGIHYPVPCHLQHPYSQFGRDVYPVATESAPELISLPMFPHLDSAQVDVVCDVLLHLEQT